MKKNLYLPLLLALAFTAKAQDFEIPTPTKVLILNYLVSPNAKYFTLPKEPTAKTNGNCYLNFYCKKSDPGPNADTANTSNFCLLWAYLICDYAFRNSTQNYDSLIFRFFSYGDTNRLLGRMAIKISTFPHLKLTGDKILECLNAILPFKDVDFKQTGKNYAFTFHQLPDFKLSNADEHLYIKCLGVFIWDYLQKQDTVNIAFKFLNDQNKTIRTYNSDQVAIAKAANNLH